MDLTVTDGVVLSVVAVADCTAFRVDVGDLVSVGVREAVGVGMPAEYAISNFDVI